MSHEKPRATAHDGFEVQHQADAAAWAVLGFVEGAGSMTVRQQYTYRTPALAPGIHRFRLKQVDFDGGFSFSPAVEVAVTMVRDYRLTPPYPNPFNPEVTVALAVRLPQPVTVAVYDILGREVQRLHDGPLAANITHTFRIDGSDLPSGRYLVRAAGEAFVTMHQVVLLK